MSEDTATRTYTYDTRRMNLREMATHSGLEYLTKVFSGEFAGSPIASTLEFYPVELEVGRVVFEGEPKQFVYNPIGSVHGGYAAALLDTVLGCSIQSTLEAGQGYTTVELKVNYVRAMTDKTGFVRAEGKIVHVGKSLATAEAKLFGRDDGKLYAHGSTTCFVFPLGQPSKP
jgi:uncharacterized protein (TIGR00369 family)